MTEGLIFEKSSKGRKGHSLPKCDVPPRPPDELIPERLLRTSPANLPEVSELDIVRHYTRLSQMNFCVDTNLYPLGSCTMKYNPKINEDVSRYEGFTCLHPYQPEEQCQGILQLLYEFETMLKDICGLDAFTFQPAAGAHGEMTGISIVQAYHRKNGDKRGKIIIPDTAHGTNPASAALCGYEVVVIRSNTEGLIDVNNLEEAMSTDVAAIMITNPNTLGLFEKEIINIAGIAHGKGGLVYCDGANMNALLGIARLGDMGIDILHLNLHKTFSGPHGGGGPASGPVGVVKRLAGLLPVPHIKKIDGRFKLEYNVPETIGKVKSFYGSIGVIIKAYAYILATGGNGLKKIGENAVLNANYIKKILSRVYEVPYGENCMHEFVLSIRKERQKKGVSALDIAKRLLDYGFYAPTIYFPLIVEEAMMIEPTETESKETIDKFVAAMIEIASEIERQPDLVSGAPHTTPINRLDEVKAARNPDLRYTHQPVQSPKT